MSTAIVSTKATYLFEKGDKKRKFHDKKVRMINEKSVSAGRIPSRQEIRRRRKEVWWGTFPT